MLQGEEEELFLIWDNAGKDERCPQWICATSVRHNRHRQLRFSAKVQKKSPLIQTLLQCFVGLLCGGDLKKTATVQSAVEETISGFRVEIELLK